MTNTDLATEAYEILTHLAQSKEDRELAKISQSLLLQLDVIRTDERWIKQENYVRRPGEQEQQKPQQQQQQQQQQQVVDAETFVEAASRVIKTRAPAYQTPVFKCMGDYEKCKSTNSYKTCMIMLVICVGKQIIPFVK
jgi:hypothetical protein